MDSQDSYTQLIQYLDQHGVAYRLIDHLPEGRTDVISPIRGNELVAAAKCIILMVKLGKKVTKYVLAVVPGDKRVDLNAIKALLGGTYISFASTEIAEKMTGCVTGTILPFSFSEELELMVDPALLQNEDLYFNAARLDRSMVLNAADYARVAKPRLENIALSDPPPTEN